MVKKIMCIVATAMLCSGVAIAAEENPVMLDFDKDGYITAKEAEVMPDLLAQFDKLDENKDGKLDMAEISAYKK